MKRLFLCISILFVHIGFASQPPSPPIARNLIILFDPTGVESNNGPLTTSLQSALKFTNDAIIITTANIYGNVLALGPLLHNTPSKFDISLSDKSGLVLMVPKNLRGPSGVTKQTPATSQLVTLSRSKKAVVADIFSLFEPDQKTISWYIMLIGHGIYSRRTAVVPYQEDLLTMYRGEALGIIAGMSIEEFQDFLGFLNTKIQTTVLYFNSCYGGGLNLALAFSNLVFLSARGNTLRAGVDPRYAIISGALMAAPTIVPGGIEKEIASALSFPAIAGLINFSEFFALTQDYFGQNKAPKRVLDKKLTDIALQLNSWPLNVQPINMIAQLPQIKFAHQDSFHVIPMNQRIMILNEVTVKKNMLAVAPGKDKMRATIQKRPIPLTGKEYALLYTPEIPLELVGRFPIQFVSMIAGPAVHVIDSITGMGDLKQFARAQMKIPSAIPKYYLIKKMGALSNVLLHVQATAIDVVPAGLIEQQTAFENQIKVVLAYYFTNGRHYLSLVYKNGAIVETFIPGSLVTNRKVQTVLDGFEAASRDSLPKRMASLHDHYIQLLELLNEGGLGQLIEQKAPAAVAFMRAFTEYSHERTHFQRHNLFVSALEKPKARVAPHNAIRNRFNELLAQDVTTIPYITITQAWDALAQQAAVYVQIHPEDISILNIQKISQGLGSNPMLEGKLAVVQSEQARSYQARLCAHQAALAYTLLAKREYQQAINRLRPFTPSSSAKILQIYGHWIGSEKKANEFVARKVVQQAMSLAQELEAEFAQFPSGVSAKFKEEKRNIAQLQKKIEARIAQAQEKERQESAQEEQGDSASGKEQQEPEPEMPDMQPAQAQLRHRIVRRYNEMLAQDPLLMPYEELAISWDELRDKARGYNGEYGRDDKIVGIQGIADGLGTVPTIEGKLAVRQNANAKEYYLTVRARQVKKANDVVETKNYSKAIELLRPFTPDTSAKIIGLYTQLIKELATSSKRQALQEAQSAQDAVFTLEQEFRRFPGGVTSKFEQAKSELERLIRSLK